MYCIGIIRRWFMDCKDGKPDQNILLPQYNEQFIPRGCILPPGNFRTYDQYQTTVLPTNIGDLISLNHPARIINDVFDNLDYAEFYTQYPIEGAPAYHPIAMLKGIFYSMFTGSYSSRKIANRFHYDIVVMYLSASQKPDYRTISRFLKRFSNVIEDLFQQVVKLCIRLGLVGMNNVAFDGTKIKANASVKKTYDMERCNKIIKKCLEEIRKLDELEDAELGDSNGEIIPANLVEPKARKEKIQELIKQIDEMEQIKTVLTQTGKKSINTTDPEANLMKNGGNIEPAYNAQLAVDSANGVIVTAYVTGEQNDTQQFIEAYESVVKITGMTPKAVTADAGYASYEVLQYLSDNNIDGYIPDTRMRIENAGKSKKLPKSQFVYNIETDEYTCPGGRTLHFSGNQKTRKGESKKKYTTDCKDCPLHGKCTKSKHRTITRHPLEHLQDTMRKKLMSDAGKAIYNERMYTVENVHADVKYNDKCCEFSVRAKNNANSQLLLYSILHNLKKIVKFSISSTVELSSSLLFSTVHLVSSFFQEPRHCHM